MELALLQFWQDNTTVSSDNLSQTTKPLYKVLLGLFMKPGHLYNATRAKIACFVPQIEIGSD